MTTVGIIGAGYIGGTVARLAKAAGYDVVLSNSRGPETLADKAEELDVRVATAEDAAKAGDLVVVAVPLGALRDLPAEQLAGKPVLDTNNYYPDRDGHFAELDDGSLTSSQLEQQHLAGAKLVKVFNNIYFEALWALARPSGAADRSALPVASDDADAKRAAVEFLDRVGYDAVDAGGLADTWRYQPDTPLYAAPYSGMVDPPSPAGTDRVRELLDQAER